MWKMVSGMKQNNYVSTIYKIAFAQFFILFNLNINTINLLPNWVGYYLFHKALPVIGEYEESAKLLRPFTFILGIYEMIVWVLQIINISLESYTILQVIIGVISIYFQFQLLTNISDIAYSHHFDTFAKRFKTLRTMSVISVTFASLPIDWSMIKYMNLVIGLFGIMVMIWLCFVLVQYANAEKEYKKELAN